MGARNDADLRQRIWSSIAQPGEATNATMSKKRDCRTFLFGNTALALSWQQSVFKRSAAFRIQALNSERWKRLPHPRIRIFRTLKYGLAKPEGQHYSLGLFWQNAIHRSRSLFRRVFSSRIN